MPAPSAASAPPLRRRLAAALGVAILAWTGVACAVAAGRFADRLLGPPRPAGATRWNPGEHAAGRLEAFLAAVEPRVPPGRLVLFSLAAAPAEEEYFQSLWAAYYLPRQRVIRARHPAAAAGEYLVLVDGGGTAPPAGGEELLRHPAGALYRLPAAAGPGGGG